MNIYVGNLSFDATEADVEQAFGEFGEVKSVNIVKDRENPKEGSLEQWPSTTAEIERPEGKLEMNVQREG